MRVKLMFVWLMITTIGLVLSCSKDESSPEPEIKLNPFSFDVFKKELGYDFVEIQWTASLISDKSKVVYDVYIEGELKGTDLESLSYRFKDLEAVTTYNVEVIAKSIYKTQVAASYSFTTQDTPNPAAISLTKDELSSDQIKVSWVNSDAAQKLTYAIYLNDVLKAEDLDGNEYTFTELVGNKLYRIKLIGKNEFDKTVESILELTTSDYSDPNDFSLSIESLALDGAKIIWSGSESEELTYRVLLNAIEQANDLEVLAFEFKSLVHNTPYTATVEAKNEHGKVKTKLVEFTTLDADGPADFKIFVENISHESALVRWETTGDKNETLSYRVFVNGFFKGEASNDNQLVLDRLDANKLHKLRIEAKNTYNKTLEKNSEFKTLTAPSLSGFTISANEIKATTALLSWTESVASDGSKVTYDIYYENGVKAKSGLEGREFQLEGLQADKSYEFKVEARCKSVILPLAQTVSFTTKSYEIPGNFELSLGEITKSQGEVKWTNSELPSGGAITYEAYLDGIVYSYAASGNAYIFKNLKAGTTYTAKIVAKSQNNAINEKTIDFTTDAEAIPEVTIDFANVKNRSFELKWDLSESPSYDNYELFLDGKSIKSGYFKTYIFNELQSNTSYKVKVIGKRGGKIYQKEIDVRTLAYAEAIDFNMEVDLKSYSQVEIDLNDFAAKNSAQFEDFNNMTYEAYLNGVKEDWGKAVSSKTLTKLKEQTFYNFQLIIRHADGSIALDKSAEFTTPANEAPVWEDNLSVKQVGFSFVEVSAKLPEDVDGNIVKYTYYVNDIAINDTYYSGNTRGTGQVDRGINNNNEPILISHLESNKSYSFYVLAVDAEGQSSKSNKVEFRTTPDSRSVFDIMAVNAPNVKTIGPRWSKMGAVSSMKEIRIIWLVDGVKMERGQYITPSKVKELGNEHSLVLDYSPFLKKNPSASLSFTVLIEWIDKESSDNSESIQIVVQ